MPVSYNYTLIHLFTAGTMPSNPVGFLQVHSSCNWNGDMHLSAFGGAQAQPHCPLQRKEFHPFRVYFPQTCVCPNSSWTWLESTELLSSIEKNIKLIVHWLPYHWKYLYCVSVAVTVCHSLSFSYYTLFLFNEQCPLKVLWLWATNHFQTCVVCHLKKQIF